MTITGDQQSTVAAEPSGSSASGSRNQSDLLALGIVPVGATKWLEFPDGNSIVVGPMSERGAGFLTGADKMDGSDGIPSRPSRPQATSFLALYAGPTKDDFTKLSAIADTVVFGKEYVDYGIPWDVQARWIVGRAVGRPEAMAEKVEQQEADRCRSRESGLLRGSAHGDHTVRGPVGLRRQDPPGSFKLINELGFVDPPAGQAVPRRLRLVRRRHVEPERAEILDVDTLVCFADEGEQQSQIETKLFKTRSVHRGTHGLVTHEDLGRRPLLRSSPRCRCRTCWEVRPRVAAAVDGDPATATEEGA